MDDTLEKKIISLEVRNFKSINHIKLNFKKNNINLIYGDNGIGKTTFVEIFDFINKLWGQLEIDKNDNEIIEKLQLSGSLLFNNILNNKFKNFFSINDKDQIKPIEIKIKFKLFGNIFKYQLIYKENYVDFEKLSILNFNQKDKEIIFSKTFNKELNISKKVENFHKDKNLSVTNKSKYSIISIMLNYYRSNSKFIKENYSEEENKIFNLIKSIGFLFYCSIVKNDQIGYFSSSPFHFKDELKYNILIKINDKFDDNLKFYKEQVREFEKFLMKIDERIINIKFDEKIINNGQYKSYSIYFEKKINGEIVKITPKNESTGTKIYIDYFNFINAIIKHKSIVFFDEFGMHFHPALAIKILNYIKEISNKNKIQLFLTTHNSIFLDKKIINLNNKEKWIITRNVHSFIDIKNLEGENTRINNQTYFIKGLYGGQSIIDDFE